MFKFLFGKKSIEAVKETQRETLERAMGEVNAILGAMAVKPKVAVNLETGLIELDLPEQMPDEALALPAPKAPVEAVVPNKEAEASEELQAAAEAPKAAA